MYIGRGGQGLGRVGERGCLATPGAAVHHHTLVRVNAINDSLKKKKISRYSLDRLNTRNDVPKKNTSFAHA